MFQWNWYQDTINVLIAFAFLWTEWKFIKIKRRLDRLKDAKDNNHE